VLGINANPVTIKQVEVEIADRAYGEGWIEPVVPAEHTGKRVAVIGSGPAGLAAAQQLTRAGHAVTVLERQARIGGLLRYGIPEFKMEKAVLDRRLEQMVVEGTEFQTGVEVGVDLSAVELRSSYDAVVLAGGSTVGRDLPVPGRELDGIHLAMDYLKPSNEVQEGTRESCAITAHGKDVVIIGGGDTGADCLGTAHRQGARSVTQLEIMPQPPDQRASSTPWPTWPLMLRTSSAHEEGGERMFSVNTVQFLGDDGGVVSALELVDVEMVDGRFTPVDGSSRMLPAQLVLLAMGFVGPEREGLLDQLGVEMDARGNVARTDAWATNVPGVFVAGDMGRGQSLIVWAIAEGRSAASAVDAYLSGSTSLPSPILPTTRGQ
jgi:glutamate synthase (NADPH/NADH) small chain